MLEQYRSAARTLLLTSEAFDLPGDLPPGMKYVGPRLDDPAWSQPWPGLPGGDPLVLLSFSSDFQDHVPVLRRAVEALGTLPVRGVVTTGWGVEPAELPAPPNVAVLRSAAHSQVVAQADAALTHAGHGTTIRSLAAGVPVVCVPLGRDQLDVAARVLHAGAGLRVDPHAPVEELSGAVRAVLEQPTYRRRPGASRAPSRRRSRRTGPSPRSSSCSDPRSRRARRAPDGGGPRRPGDH